MLKVLIADDEPGHRMGLMKHVRWNDLGYEPPLLAEDAEEALFLTQNQRVDVLIADVCMPGIDGIELVKQLRRRYPNLYVLIISGYEEFEFARSAVEAGARAYLLKPLRIEEVERWLETFRDEIQITEQVIEADSQMKKKLNNSLQIARERFIEQLFQEEEYEEDRIKTQLGLLELPDSELAYRLAVFSLDDYAVLLAKDPKTAAFLVYRLTEIVKTALAGYEAILVKTASNRLAAFLLIKKGTGYEEVEYLNSRLGIIHKSFGNEGDVSISACISREGEAWRQASKLYREVIRTLDMVLSYERGQILWTETTLENGGPDEFDSVGIYARLAGYIRNMETERITGLLNDAYNHFTKDNRISFSFAHSFSLGIISELFRVTELSGFQPPRSFVETCAIILNCTSVYELREATIQIVLHQLRELEKNQNQKKSQVIERAYGYLQEHLADDTTVKELADIVHMNPSYLSVLFKKEMGETISDYVNRLRIEKARQLLQQGFKVSDIARQVGYQNPSYFANQFKKALGFTPAEFRKRRSG